MGLATKHNFIPCVHAETLCIVAVRQVKGRKNAVLWVRARVRVREGESWGENEGDGEGARGRVSNR